MKYVRLGAALVLPACMALFPGAQIGCAPQADHFKAKLMHRDDRLTSEQFSNQTILLTPLIRNAEFDTISSISPFVFAERLRKIREDMTIQYIGDFQKAFMAVHPEESLQVFYDYLKAGDILKIQTCDSAWAYMPATYMLLFRLRNAGRVRDWHGVVRRKISLEAEIWDTRQAAVVWRVQVTGFDPDTKTSDADFILKGIDKAYSLLPGFRPALHESDW